MPKPPAPKRGRPERLDLLILVLIFLLAAGATACSDPAASQPATSKASTGTAKQKAAQPAAEEKKAEEDEGDAIAVSVVNIAREPLSSLYATSATLRADRRAVVTARTHGVIRELQVEEGDLVTEGQILAVLENDEQQINHNIAVTTRDTKGREFDRAQSLHDQGLLSEEEYETARREADESEHGASLSELLLERTVIRAPFTGKILLRHLDVGGTVSDGTSIYDIADLDPLYADVNVPERQVSRLQAGQLVRLIADSSGDEARARIERIAPQVDPATGTVKVTLAVDRETRLKPGSFVRVEVVTSTHQQALVVPRSALVAEGRRWHIFRVKEDGKHVEQLEVIRGFEEGDRVEILETLEAELPLVPGDAVVHVGASALTDDALVQVIGDEEETGETSAEETSADGEVRVAT